MAPRPPGQPTRYLYERLGEKRFEELCGALLAHSFPDVTCYPVGQKDGGRDIVQKRDGRSYVYQVKWTSSSLQDPVPWLDKTVKDEAANIRYLAANGAERYLLLTSVAGTAERDRGTMDKLDQRLLRYSTEFDIKMECWWRADIDARLDVAPDTLKWTYQEMLAGVDAVRYLMEAHDFAEQEQRLRMLLLKVMATQWREDSKVKFKQVELESHDLADLFVDVEAVRLAHPRRAAGLLTARGDHLGGAAQYLLTTSQPLTLVRGEPGQGKSTLGQFLCQVQRGRFLPDNEYRPGSTPKMSVSSSRLPLRIDLRDYATWLLGSDPFSDSYEEPKKIRARPKNLKVGSLENFIAALLTAKSGGVETSVEIVHDVLYRIPVLLVLDGLDEVAEERIRSRVVREIDEFSSRLGGSTTAPQIVVTTRPNASSMPEPSSDTFETIALTRLSQELRTTYLRKWADTQGIRGRDRRDLERTFRQRSGEPHILQLADNPMQLTILLYLMQKRGNSVPSGRTDLYTSYMETFLDREAAKTAAVDEHRDDLEEVTSYLGWYLQALAETTASNGQLPTRALKKAILDYLFGVEKDTSLVDSLFTAVTDRVWALTSKVQGTFEFDVQPLREYFAARFLNEFAGADNSDFDSSVVLRNLVRRAYWLNTSRFYAGFAKPNELAGLVEGLEEEFADTSRPWQVRLATWTLIADGVFSSRPRTQRRSTDLLSDDLSVRLLAHAMGSDPEMSSLAWDRGGRTFAEKIQEQLVETPTSLLANERARLLARLMERPDFDAWWQERIKAAKNQPQQLAWLWIGGVAQAPSRLSSATVDKLELQGAGINVALESGVTPTHGSALEERMIRAVLDGQCSDLAVKSMALAADLLKVMAPQHHLRRAVNGDNVYLAAVGHLDEQPSDSQLRAAFQRLIGRDERFQALRRALRFNKGQMFTTAPWGNSARALAAIYGPCWLAAETAIIGATLHGRFTTNVDITRGSEPFGPAADYGRLLQDLRSNRKTTAWWKDQIGAHQDPLSSATWALALISVADEQVLVKLLETLGSVAGGLPQPMRNALVLSSSRIGAFGHARRLDASVLKYAAAQAPTIGLLIAHHAVGPGDREALGAFEEDDLLEMLRDGVSAWPAITALTYTAMGDPSPSHLETIRRIGPSGATPRVTLDRNTPPNVASAVLEQAGRYPLSWVLAAQEHFSTATALEPMQFVAEHEGWFDSLTS